MGRLFNKKNYKIKLKKIDNGGKIYMQQRRSRSITKERPIIRDEINDVANEIIKNTDKILKKGTLEDINLFIDLSEKFGKLCSKYKFKQKTISTSQIRAIFQTVKRLPDDFESSKKHLNLLRPKLAYQKGRFEVLEPLTRVLIHLIKNVNDNDTLEGFKEFFEAIIAYHKAYGGKE